VSAPFDGQKVVAFDTETRGLEWWREDQRAFLAQWADESGEWHAVMPGYEHHRQDDQTQSRRGTPEQFLRALAAADVIAAHNLPFDVHQVRETLGIDILTLGKELHDTDILLRIANPIGAGGQGYGFGLKENAVRHIDPEADRWEKIIEERAKEIGLRTLKKQDAYYQVWLAFPDEMEEYGRMDTRYTRDILLKFYPRLQQDARLSAVYQLEMEVQPTLIRAEARGIAVDQPRVKDLVKEYKAAELELRDRLETELGDAALGGEGSETALREGLLMVGVPLYRTTQETEELATNHFALQEFEDDYPVVGDLMEWRRVTKFLSTYLEPAVDVDAMHPSFMQAEAKTGRMSARRPNMQNVPKRAGKEVRSIFVPREGNAFVASDFESIEVRLLAYYLGQRGEAFTQLIESGFDPHAWMASQLFGGDPSQYEKGTPGEELRGQAKNGLFAILYGGGGKRLSDMFKLPPEPFYEDDHPAVVRAKKRSEERGSDFYWPREGWQYAQGYALARKIKASVPGYYHLTKNRIIPKVEMDGYLSTMFGRKQVIAADKSYTALNRLIQGSAADVFKQAVVNVARALEPIGWQPILFVHDEIVSEGPKELAEEAQRRQDIAMRSAADFRPKLEVSSSIVTTSYADA
jgi:DNA polymerase-1